MVAVGPWSSVFVPTVRTNVTELDDGNLMRFKKKSRLGDKARWIMDTIQKRRSRWRSSIHPHCPYRGLHSHKLQHITSGRQIRECASFVLQWDDSIWPQYHDLWYQSRCALSNVEHIAIIESLSKKECKIMQPTHLCMGTSFGGFLAITSTENDCGPWKYCHLVGLCLEIRNSLFF